MILNDNRTLRILSDARKAGDAGSPYGVLGAVCYNIEHVTAFARAAERKRSPIILLLFPSTVKQLPTLAAAAHAAISSATVPISLHLDHAQDEDLIEEIAANLPFASIMVDMSHYDHGENLEKTRALTAICHKKGIAVEAEIGRINGGEDGIAHTGDLAALFTSPGEVEDFIEAGIDILAPSIGNIHGEYGPEGPQLDLERLKEITEAVRGRVHVALHGTNSFSPELMRHCIEAGAIKLNVNKLLLKGWNEHLANNAHREPLMQLIEKGMEILQEETERWMDICGSSGRA